MKASKKDIRDAHRVAAASIRATIDGMVGNVPQGMLKAMIAIAVDMERKGAGGTRDPVTLETFLVPGEARPNEVMPE